MIKMTSNKGFTLVETLACIVTLLLVTMICSTGMKFALNVYKESLFESESQTLESTLNVYMGDILRNSKAIQTETDPVNAATPEIKKVLSFTNSGYQIYDGTIEVSERVNNAGGRFMVHRKNAAEAAPLVNGKIYGNDMYISDFLLTYNEQTGVFYGSFLIKTSISEKLVKECTFVYRTISEIN